MNQNKLLVGFQKIMNGYIQVREKLKLLSELYTHIELTSFKTMPLFFIILIPLATFNTTTLSQGECILSRLYPSFKTIVFFPRPFIK